MDEKTKVALIRKGNEAYNNGDIATATKIFKATLYQSGLIRLGDFWLEQQKPLVAYGYYKLAKYESRIKSLQQGFAFALKCWLGEEPTTKTKSNLSSQANDEVGPSRLVSKEKNRQAPHVILELDESLLE